MANEQRSDDNPEEWLYRARSNLIRAKVVLEGVDLADNCFDAQQAAEKSLKAVFIQGGIAFPFTHDIATLIRLLDRAGVSVPKYLRAADKLTQYATLGRYPESGLTTTERKRKHLVKLAEKVLRWAERKVAAK